MLNMPIDVWGVKPVKRMWSVRGSKPFSKNTHKITAC
jgi:hypothetical protein